jgi:hypothetical protein
MSNNIPICVDQCICLIGGFTNEDSDLTIYSNRILLYEDVSLEEDVSKVCGIKHGESKEFKNQKMHALTGRVRGGGGECDDGRLRRQ